MEEPPSLNYLLPKKALGYWLEGRDIFFFFLLKCIVVVVVGRNIAAVLETG